MGGFCLEDRRETWEMEILFLSMARYSFSEFDVHSLQRYRSQVDRGLEMISSFLLPFRITGEGFIIYVDLSLRFWFLAATSQHLSYSSYSLLNPSLILPAEGLEFLASGKIFKP